MVEVVRAVRQAVGPGFPFHPGCRPGEQQNYDASLARTPDELEEAGAGVDSLHISQRWFWMPAFDQGLMLAGWVKKLTGLTVITAGLYRARPIGHRNDQRRHN
jgi:hypothetical protein